MNYYQICPQIAGTVGDNTTCPDWSARPVVMYNFQFELESWPDDDLIVATIQGYAGTERLVAAIKAAGLTGVEFDQLDMIKGDQFWLWEDEHPGETIPKYLWFKFPGRATFDDFGMISLPDVFSLIVSQRALDLLESFKFSNCRIKEFDPSMFGSRHFFWGNPR